MLQTIEPAILYFGTPVVLVSSLNEDGTTNIAPMSSAWWLGWSCMLGFDASSQTVANLRRLGECVLNLAAVENADQVNRLALYTGRQKVPLHKKHLGYQYAKDKFALAGFTAMSSETIAPTRIRECPIQLEAKVTNIHTFGKLDQRMSVPAVAVEVVIQKVHAQAHLLESEHPNRIHPDRWNPLLMCFRKFYGKSEEVQSSRLHRGAEEKYAPWKLKGFKGLVTRPLLSLSNRKYL